MNVAVFWVKEIKEKLEVTKTIWLDHKCVINISKPVGRSKGNTDRAWLLNASIKVLATAGEGVEHSTAKFEG